MNTNPKTQQSLADRSAMDHILEAIRKIHAHSAELAKGHRRICDPNFTPISTPSRG